MRNVIISHTGSCLGERIIPNSYFLGHTFFGENGVPLKKPTAQTVEQLENISTIRERRYSRDGQCTTDLVIEALQNTGADLNSLDYLIVPNDFADTLKLGEPEINWLPSRASIAKKRLGIRDPNIVALDVFCSGWEWDIIEPKLRETNLGEILCTNCDEIVDIEKADVLIHRTQLQGEHPSIASRGANKLGINNDLIKVFDIAAGCGGCLEGVILSYELIKSGHANRVGIVSAEVLSRVCDPHDYDSMLYADGGGAVILEAKEADERFGILSYSHKTDSTQADLLTLGPSYNPKCLGTFLKMDGRGVRLAAEKLVHVSIKESLQKAGLAVSDMKMALLHQANYHLNRKAMLACGIPEEELESKMPMVIDRTGNFSQTVLYLIDHVFRGKMRGYELSPGDIVNFVSIGAGLTWNSVTYRMPPESALAA